MEFWNGKYKICLVIKWSCAYNRRKSSSAVAKAAAFSIWKEWKWCVTDRIIIKNLHVLRTSARSPAVRSGRLRWTRRLHASGRRWRRRKLCGDIARIWVITRWKKREGVWSGWRRIIAVRFLPMINCAALFRHMGIRCCRRPERNFQEKSKKYLRKMKRHRTQTSQRI